MFSVTKRVLAEFDKLYAIAGVVDQGHFKTCYAASEGREGRCVQIDLEDGRVESCGSRDEIVPMLFLDQAGCTCLDREGGNGNEAGCSY